MARQKVQIQEAVAQAPAEQASAIQAPEVQAQGAPTETAPAAPIKLSGMNRLMSIVPRVVEGATETAHKSIRALAESAKKLGDAIRESRQAQSELLLSMLDDITGCLLARKDGAKTVKNADIERVLIENGVKEPRFSRLDGQPIIGSKSGASRYIALCNMQHEELWDPKKAQALRFIKAHGLAMDKSGKKYDTPFKALLDGQPYTAVHDIWVKWVKALNDEVSPPVKVSPLETLAARISKLKAPERAALAAAISATLTQVGVSVPTTETKQG